jgi:hypothetical protein
VVTRRPRDVGPFLTVDSFGRQSRHGIRTVLAIVAVVLLALLVAFVSLSDGVDYVHGFGGACVVAHSGWHFHWSCGNVHPPVP